MALFREPGTCKSRPLVVFFLAVCCRVASTASGPPLCHMIHSAGSCEVLSTGVRESRLHRKSECVVLFFQKKPF